MQFMTAAAQVAATWQRKSNDKFIGQASIRFA
jgi:hypothetical protein